jgi:hypothetical protein
MRRLACLAFLSALTVAGGAEAMTYGLVPFQDGSAAIVARGRIEGNETARLLTVWQAAQERGVVPNALIVSSPGGNVASALDLGQTLRQLGLRTVVGALAETDGGQPVVTGGNCHSACVMVLMGGVNRSVLPGSRVGVHSPQIQVVLRGQNYVLDEATTRYMVQRTEPALRSYARHMGVNPALIDVAHGVPHTSIRTLTSSEMARYGLVTSGPGRRATRKAEAKRTASARHGRRS